MGLIGTKLPRTWILLLSVALAVAGGAAPVRAATSAQAVGALNAQRAANGIPASIVGDPARDTGCDHHNNYMLQNGNMLQHGETFGNPGYTADGAMAPGTVSEFDAEVLASPQSNFVNPASNPWNNAPIHLMLMLTPGYTRAGFADSFGFSCMRLGASAAVPGPFYSYPGPGATGVQTAQTASEGPYTPQTLVGIPDGQTTGPNILAYAPNMARPATATSGTLTGPSGAVATKLVSNATPPAAGINFFSFNNADLIPVSPLAVGNYTATINWRGNDGALATQTFSFMTAGPTPVGGSSGAATGSGGGSSTTTGAGGEVMTPPPPKPPKPEEKKKGCPGQLSLAGEAKKKSKKRKRKKTGCAKPTKKKHRKGKKKAH